MNQDTVLPGISSTMYIEAHQQHIDSMKALANQAFFDDASFTVTELWLYVINVLKSRNGTGIITPLRLQEFQTQQWRRYGTEPALCRDVWHSFAWPPFAVSRPSPIR